MSGWQKLRAERNRRSLGRLTKALPVIFPRVVLARAFARPFVPPTPRLAIESYWGAHGAAYPLLSARHPRRTVKPLTQWARDFAASAVNPFIASAGTLTCGAAVPTKTRSGIVLAWWRGSSGMRQVTRSDFCGASKVGAALKAADGYGGTPKLTIASRCSGSGANTGTRPGRDCSIFGDCPTSR